MQDEETKDVFGVIVNTDLTEGRGRQYIKHLCELEATAVRLARKADVQGSDGTIRRITLVKRNSAWFGPVTVEMPTQDDLRTQPLMDAHQAAEKKARELGLTDADLTALRRTI